MPNPLTPELKNHVKSTHLAALRFRRAIKSFDPARRLDPADFDFIAEAARLAPSSNGLEPWNIIVLASGELRAKFVERTGANAAQAGQASHLVAFTAKTARGIDPSGDYLAHIGATVHSMSPEQIEAWRGRFKAFLTNRIGVWGSDDAMFGYTARQAYLALENMIVAAAAIEVDSCPLEGLDYAQATAVLAEAGLIDPALDAFAVAAVFGYRSEDPKRPQARRPIGEVVAWA
ncbi:MAG: nitroreductase family protein [Bifidobacteriaceae bacterium]|jgi:nitroreductase|nr:nitroreductase family protein [Bifidobacteriaceae bacterium]